jgi:hypothetical protein
MDGYGPDTPATMGPAVPEYESMAAPRSGAAVWFMILFHLPLGLVPLALAMSEDFAAGKATFAGDTWRITLGAVGAGLTFLALRGIVRNLSDNVPKITPERQRRARVSGSILFLVGQGFLLASGFDGIGDSTVSFHSWTKPFFIVGGIYLMLMGLVFQANPKRLLGRERITKGEGNHGIARILRAGDTGMSVNNQPQVTIDFEIDVNGRVHQASDKIVMERAKLALLIPGSTVDVLVDQVDPNVFHVYWDSWKPPP